MQGHMVLLPAELVFLPYPVELSASTWFGSSSNGLCSGNSILEASIHGLCEVVERDTTSFLAVRDISYRIPCKSLVGNPAALASRISNAGFVLHLRCAETESRLPWFGAWIVDPETYAPLRVTEGFGCHPIKEVAAVRAICEAAQARLSFIHGGRDDIVERYALFANMGRDIERKYLDRLIHRVSDEAQTCQWDAVPDCQIPPTLEGLWHSLLIRLKEIGFDAVCRVVLTAPEHPVQVVRIVVPRMELFEYKQQRVGPRLLEHVRAGT
jgi:ribosomal protein S12 methylthiotransferase accessory factor